MIACGKCHKAIELQVGFVLRFPKHVARICDDCGLLLDHFNEPGTIVPFETVI